VAKTQAVYYRDKRGVEPVDLFVEGLSAKRAAKIDDFIEEHLNGRPSGAPPPEHPISSQIEGELRELRVRFAIVVGSFRAAARSRCALRAQRDRQGQPYRLPRPHTEDRTDPCHGSLSES
jgi:hypothetical protein